MEHNDEGLDLFSLQQINMAMENPHVSIGNTSSTGPFSIAMLLYQRVFAKKLVIFNVHVNFPGCDCSKG